jgi:hypothetical protein
MDNEQEVAGLKQAIGKQANIRRSVEQDLAKMNKLFAKSLGVLMEMDVATEQITEMVWKYVEINENWWTGSSRELGVFTTIGDYTNKKGRTSKAHFTENGKYLYPAKEGDRPEAYQGNFRVTREKFDFNIQYDILTDWEIVFFPK